MRFVLTLSAGLVLGYALHSKKDDSIDQIVNSIKARVDTVVDKRSAVTERFTK